MRSLFDPGPHALAAAAGSALPASESQTTFLAALENPETVAAVIQSNDLMAVVFLAATNHDQVESTMTAGQAVRI